MRVQKSKSAMVDLIPNPILLPGESQAEFDKLKTALIGELSPETAFETLLANDLVMAGWETIRHRRLRDELVVSSSVMATAEMLDGGTKPGGPTQESLQCGQALARQEGTPHARALEMVGSRGYQAADMVAAGYQKSFAIIQAHDNRIAELSRRRKKLRDEYTQLQDLRRPSDNDATEVGQ